DVVAVEGLTLDVSAGEFFTMLGPSGSGKTTTLRVIAGFELADAGTVALHGVDVTRRPPYERPVNTVFQDYALFPHMSVAEHVTFIYVTHDQDEALTMSDRVAVFSDGRLEQVGTPGDIYERPANEFVAGFVGTSNMIERGGQVRTVRPEKIRLLAEGESS